MAEAKTIPQRDQIPVESTWDTTAIYPTDEAWEKEFDETQAQVRTLPQYAGRLGESAKTLYEFLTTFMQAEDQLANLYRYASLRQDEDTRVPQYQAMAGKAMSLLVETNAAIAFATRLRGAGIRTQLYTEQKKFKQKMSYADKLGVPFAAFLGEDEIRQGKVSLKDMGSGEQKLLDLDQAADAVLEALAAGRNAPPIREKEDA